MFIFIFLCCFLTDQYSMIEMAFLILSDRIIRSRLVRDSSAVRRLFVRLAGAVGRRSALHKESKGFATPTPGRHISTFRGYRILFSIRNPYINHFTNHFSINS
jgi:hypothetical protein